MNLLIFLCAEKDANLGFCVNYCKLDAVSVRDSYSIPGMDEFINSLGPVNVFLTLDADSGYWQIELLQKRHELDGACHA